uniref:protein-S-isoprenylcysteine alpha-carbonyl methylesterase n=1 Tax=Aegilops tauschii TaxID=37682 RepID=M8BL57_AEGTA
MHQPDSPASRSGTPRLRKRDSSAPNTPRAPPCGLGGVGRRTTFREDVGHAAAETYLVTRLTFILLRSLGVGSRWICQLLALLIYAVLLMPGFIRVGYYYFFSSQVLRSIVYGDQPRNRLDMYIPTDRSKPNPVVVFVTGGAWIIGYKAWGALLGRRNFPQGTISDMVTDASEAISFICDTVASYGGDPNQIYLMGQSAGAHIAACALLEQAVKESQGEEIYWSVTQIKSYFGLSGGYNMQNLVDHFHKRGLYRSIFLSKIFADVLKKAGAKAKVQLYRGKTHTDVFVQDPLRGGKDPLVEDVVSIIHAADADARRKYDDSAPSPERLVDYFISH